MSIDRDGERITPRERQILELMCEGLSNPEIVATCRIRATTVKTHQKSLYQKFGVGSRSQVIVHALRSRLVCPDWLADPAARFEPRPG